MCGACLLLAGGYPVAVVRHGEVLIQGLPGLDDVRDATGTGDRTHRDLADDDVARIASTYHAWRGEKDAGTYKDISGFCKSASLEAVRKLGHVLTPGPYVGAEAQQGGGEPLEQKMKRLAARLRDEQAEAAKMDVVIAANLKELGYGG